MRARLPNRRPLETTELVEANGRVWMLGVGFDAAGKAREVFLKGTKEGSELELIAEDACVLASLLLQSGTDAAFLAERLGRAGGRPATFVGAMLLEAAAVEAAAGQGIREAQAASAGPGTGGARPAPRRDDAEKDPGGGEKG